MWEGVDGNMGACAGGSVQEDVFSVFVINISSWSGLQYVSGIFGN